MDGPSNELKYYIADQNLSNQKRIIELKGGVKCKKHAFISIFFDEKLELVSKSIIFAHIFSFIGTCHVASSSEALEFHPTHTYFQL